MKLTVNDVKSVENASPLELFHQGNKTAATDVTYTNTLKNVFCTIFEDVLTGTFEERAGEFVRKSRADPTWCRNMLISVSKLMRKRSEFPDSHKDYFSPSSFSTYFAAIKKLLVMNEILINWNAIYRTFPEKTNNRNSRGWTRKEIAQLLKSAEGSKYRALILLLASSGIRIGAFCLRWDDFTPVYWKEESLTDDPATAERLACVAVRVYAGSVERYTTFVTPEAWGAIQEWRTMWEYDVGRETRPDDPVFKKDGIFPEQLALNAVLARLKDIIDRSKIRSDHTMTGRRYDVPMAHGFRRFWNKTVKDAMSADSPVSSLTKKEYMLGHTGMTAMDRSYYHTNMLELAKEYVMAIPALTIGDEERLRLKIMRNANESEQSKGMEMRIADLEQLVKDLSARLASGSAHPA